MKHTLLSTLRPRRSSTVAALAALLLASPAGRAATVTSSTTVKDGNALTVALSSTISYKGSADESVSLKGNNTVTILGMVENTAAGSDNRAIRGAKSTSALAYTLTVGSESNSTATVRAKDDAIQFRGYKTLFIDNWGLIASTETGQAITLDKNFGDSGNYGYNSGGYLNANGTLNNTKAISATITNHLTGTISAVGNEAIKAGSFTTVNNDGVIITAANPATGSVSSAVSAKGKEADTNAATRRQGLVVNNTGLIEGGKHGVTGEGLATITNAGTIRGLDGSGINFDFLGESGEKGYNVTVNNSGLIEGNTAIGNTDANADGDAIDIDHNGTITNSGTIQTVRSNRTADAISIGGGSVTNQTGGLISAANSKTSEKAYAINVIGIDVNRNVLFSQFTLTNEANATIKTTGNNGTAISISGTLSDTITNHGVISSESSLTIDTGTGTTTSGSAYGYDTVINSGTITALSTGTAIRLGNNGEIHITGGNAKVVGDMVAEGVSTIAGIRKIDFAIGTGTFTYNNSLKGFNQADVLSGVVRLQGNNSTYGGVTTVKSGAALSVENNSGSASGSSAVVIEANSLLTGNGSIKPTGARGVEIAGRLAPGLGAALNGGTPSATGQSLTIDLSGYTGLGAALSFQTGAVLEFTLDVAALALATQASDLRAMATLELIGAKANSVSFAGTEIKLTMLGEGTLAAGDYLLISTDFIATPGATDTFSGVGAEAGEVGIQSFSGLTLAGAEGAVQSQMAAMSVEPSLSLNVQSNGIYLHVAPVPEPSSVALLCLAGLTLATMLRRRGRA